MTNQLGRLAKNALIYGTGDVLTKIVGFLLLPLFTAYLTPDDYGVSSILGMVTFIVMWVFSLGLGSAIGVVYSDNQYAEHRPATLWTTVILLVISAAVLLLLTVSFSIEISTLVFRSPTYAHLLTIAVTGTCFTIIATPFSLYYQFEQKAVTYTVISLSSALITIFLSVTMVSVLRLGIQGWVAASLMGQGITLLLYAIPTILRLKFDLRADIAKALLRMGIPLIPSFAFLFVLQQSNRFFLERISGLDAVGIYAVGSNLGITINLIIQSFMRAWFPYFLSFSNKQEEAKTLFGRITTYYLVGGGSLTLCFFIFARPVTLIMTAPAFHTAYMVIGWVAMAQFLIGLFNLLLPAIYFAQDVSYQTLIQAGAAAATVGACWLLIPSFGAVGAAVAYTLGALAMCVLTYVWNIHHREYFRVIYEQDRVIKFGLFFGVLVALSVIPRDFSITVEIALSALGILALVIFVYLFIDTNEKDRLLQLLRRVTPFLAKF